MNPFFFVFWFSSFFAPTQFECIDFESIFNVSCLFLRILKCKPSSLECLFVGFSCVLLLGAVATVSIFPPTPRYLCVCLYTIINTILYFTTILPYYTVSWCVLFVCVIFILFQRCLFFVETLKHGTESFQLVTL
jgi:hypothetical protein